MNDCGYSVLSLPNGFKGTVNRSLQPSTSSGNIKEIINRREFN